MLVVIDPNAEKVVLDWYGSAKAEQIGRFA